MNESDSRRSQNQLVRKYEYVDCTVYAFLVDNSDDVTIRETQESVVADLNYENKAVTLWSLPLDEVETYSVERNNGVITIEVEERRSFR